MTGRTSCESCGMPIDAGPYCQYCVDRSGNLKPFDERFESFIQWALRRDPKLDREAAEKKTCEYMSTLPAWKDHPKVRAARA